MGRKVVHVLLFTFGTLLTLSALPSGSNPWPLLVMGGDSTRQDIVAHAVEGRGGASGPVAVLPQSSAGAGDGSLQMWLDDVERARHEAGVVLGASSAGAAVV